MNAKRRAKKKDLKKWKLCDYYVTAFLKSAPNFWFDYWRQLYPSKHHKRKINRGYRATRTVRFGKLAERSLEGHPVKI